MLQRTTILSLTWLILCGAAPPSLAAEFRASDVSAFDKSIRQLKPGDMLLMENGEWSDAILSIVARGTAEQPITLRAATPGKVQLTGSSQLRIGGEHLLVEGLHFHNCQPKSGAIVEFRNDSKTLAQHCTLRDCALTEARDFYPRGDVKWLSLYGQKNVVEHCHFVGKKSVGTLLVVWLPENKDAQPVQHQLKRNYFGERQRLERNGGETIRIGDSKTSLQMAKCLVEENLFEKCDGEIECISNKSCSNIYRGNIFLECQGTITLRHGNGCTVENNLFLGDFRGNTGGIRIIGEDHIVRGNQLFEITGNDARAAICLMNGIENSPANGYLQVKNARIENNTIVACRQSLHIGYADDDVTAKLPPIDCRITGNTIYSPSNTAITLADPMAKLSWSENKLNSEKPGIEATPGIEIIRFARPETPEPPSRELFGVKWKMP